MKLLPLLLFMASYFVLGALAIWWIGRGKAVDFRRRQWLKFFTYLGLSVIVFAAIWSGGRYFGILSIIISVIGAMEVLQLWRNSAEQDATILVSGIIVYSILIIGFIHFAMHMLAPLVMATYLLVLVFDAFCQLSGQLFGRRKLIPAISPAKTLEGLLGGTLITLLTAIGLSGWVGIPMEPTMKLAIILCITAFAGDLLASWYKRLNGAKDFGAWLPGHGGLLDRYDSLIFSAAIIYYLHLTDYLI